MWVSICVAYILQTNTQGVEDAMEMGEVIAGVGSEQQNDWSDQQSYSGSSLTPMQRARMESQRQMAIFRQKARQKNGWTCTRVIQTDSAMEEEEKKEQGLTRQQMNVLKAIGRGESVFVTGSAGTGKSYLLEFAVKTLRSMHSPDCVFVTASTGLAACGLNGTTLHSFAGIGLGEGSKEDLLAKVQSSRRSAKRWRIAKALIIDEISMIDGEMFDKLNYIASNVRGPARRVFGGLQLLVTGDFFQLPPVNPENPRKYFAFEAECWDKCFDRQIELTTVFRQPDSAFVEMLQQIRRGEQNLSTIASLSECYGPSESDAGEIGVALTRLYPRKFDVGKENDDKLKALSKPIVVFYAKDSGPQSARFLLENGRAPKQVALCLGAQVMLIKNISTETGLVNGARGVVVEFVEDLGPDQHPGEPVLKEVSPSGIWPRVRFACGMEMVMGPQSWSVMEGNKEVAKRTQVPLILAWALSVHKCQGMTLDRVETDLSRAFEYGMVYVALSRVKALQGLRLTGFDPSKIRVHPKVIDFYQRLIQFKHDSDD